jgi:endoglucanase
MNDAGHQHSAPNTKPWLGLGLLCAILAFAPQAYAGAAPGIKIVGNKFVTTSAGTLGTKSVTSGEAVVLRGLNVSGSEYSCLGDGTNDGSATVWDSSNLPANTSDYQAVVNGMINNWHANVVRIPLNEDCWLGEPTSGQSTMLYGSNYITPIVNFISVANASGLVVEVDLHVGGGPELVSANSSQIDNFPALDTNYSLLFWQSVATQFKNNPSVIFNLTNEPEFAGSGSTAAADWTCYLNGGCNTTACQNNGCQGPNGSGNTWNVQGVASVVTAIRNEGASNVIIIAGLDYSNQLNDWLTYVPAYVSDKQIAAGIHLYYDLDCTTSSCWTSTWTPILTAGYPIVIDETGELPKNQGGDGCTGSETNSMVSWANGSSPQVGYWFWAFTKAGGCSEPVLLKTNSSPFTAASGYGAAAQSALTAIQ